MTEAITANKQAWNDKYIMNQALMERANKVFHLIERAKCRRDNHLTTAREYSLFKSIREKAVHNANISTRAIGRLQTYFNNITSEIQF